MNLVVALLAGVISITGGIYSLKNNVFSGPSYGTLQGIVRDERIAKPLRLAAVEISDLSGAVVNTATTDDNGHYLVEALKTGNYVVKFTAPLHKIETKTIKIEKNLAPSINVDLFPEAPQVIPSRVETVVPVQQNIRASYTPPAVYQPASSQTVPATDPSLSGPPRTGYRRHPHRNYSGEPVASSSGTSQATSQSDVLAQAGTQLLQTLVSSKKTEDNPSPASS
jgi:hypothetical protein